MFIVKYKGNFGFIKPYTAVRDDTTISQNFLTPSIIEGMEKKMFPNLIEEKGIFKIKNHRINYVGIIEQQEVTQSKGEYQVKKEKDTYKTNISIIKRCVLLKPNLYLAFENEEDALIAFKQTLCLCRNEDLVFPVEIFEKDTLDVHGVELLFDVHEIKVGYNRYNDGNEMFGKIKNYGSPIRY